MSLWQCASVFLDVISHVGCRPQMRSLSPLARQISSLLSDAVIKSPWMLACCGQMCLRKHVTLGVLFVCELC